MQSGQEVRLPLETHLADVGCVFEALCLLPVFRARLAQALGRECGPWDIARLAILALLHDLGKVLRGFQNRLTGERPQHGHVKPVLGLMADRPARQFLAVMPWLMDWDEAGGAVTFHLLLASFSHHGTPLPGEPDQEQARRWPKENDAQEWRYLNDLAGWLRAWFPDAFRPDAPSLPESQVLTHLFAGLVMLADWLGSDVRFFPLEREGGAQAVHDSRRRAGEAVRAVGFDMAAAHDRLSAPPEFPSQFGFSANALQAAIDDLPLPGPGGLAIIEAETGSGKTEAALRYFTRLWCDGLVDGLYVANPLRFAATQLFGRMRSFVTSTFGIGTLPLVLAVPGYLRVDEASGVLLPGFEAVWSDRPGEAVAQRRWAAEHPKRFLAAPLAVGTIDQALLAGLRTRHAHMRAAALCRSLLVIDEVHASDAYMTKLTLCLLQLFRQVGGQALLLSATLAGETRARYVRAMGGRPDVPSRSSCLSAPYPAVTTLDGVRAVADHRSEAERKPPVQCRLAPIQGDPGAVAALVSQLAEPGGRVLVLRNTVRTVTETLEALESVLPAESLFSVHGVVCPHHSRYARPDRELLDHEVERWFGKSGTCEKGVLVSSQTLEQSLDVDFDLLVTDLCPMDVLLQRIGRLHRHRARDSRRSESMRSPRCMVLVPSEMRPEALCAGKKHLYGPGLAYANLPALMATWEMLADREARGEPLRVPGESRALVEGALHSEVLEEVASRRGLQAAWVAVQGADGARAMQGQLNSIDWTEPFCEQSWNPDEPPAQTRIGSADRAVELPEACISPFGQEVRNLVLAEHLLPKGAEAEADPELVSRGPEGFVFRLGRTVYSYTRFGLRKEESA